jgi:putative transcriptional regulator
MKPAKVSTRTLKEKGLLIAPPPNISSSEIKEIRERYNISQAVLARLLGTSKGAVTQWEQGLRTPNGTAMRLLDVLRRKGVEVFLC